MDPDESRKILLPFLFVLLLGAALAGPPGWLLTALAVGVAVWAIAPLLGQRARRHDDAGALAEWAESRGLIHTPAAPVFRDTPILAAGDAQQGRHGFTGSIFGLRGTLYEHIRCARSGDGGMPGEGEHLIVLHLSCSLRIPYLLVHARGMDAPVERLAAHLTDNRFVELESSEFAQRLTIEVNRHTGDVALRRLLTPRTIVQLLDLSEHPLFAGGAFVEVYGGKLVIGTHGGIDAEAPADLDRFLTAVEPLVTTLKTFKGEPGRVARLSGSGAVR